MTLPKVPRPLRKHEIDTIRLVARGLTNEEIADQLGVNVETLRSRLANLHHLIGTTAVATGASHPAPGHSRVRMVVWAYENGLADKAPLPARLPAELEGPLLALCWSIIRDEPRGDLRRHAHAALVAAGLIKAPVVLVRKPKTEAA